MFYTIATITPIAKTLHRSNQSVVLVTGFFDLLHQEHINFLQKARSVGDFLIVGVESDARARAVKGEGRPIVSQALRCQKVKEYANYVIALPDDFNHQEAYESLLRTVRPDLYAVSSHTSYLDNKRSLVAKYGGKLVVVHDWNPRISTTQILAKS